MRIAIDVKVLSTAAALRGMGLYTQQQLQKLAQVPGSEIFLFTHGSIAESDMLFDWKNLPGVHEIPVTVDGAVLTHTEIPSFELVLEYSHRLQTLLRRLRIDLFHNATPFLYPHYSRITACPVVSTFYDAIPLIFPSDYFGSAGERLAYARSLQNVIDSDGVIAISAAAAHDLRCYTGYAQSKITIVHPAISAALDKLSQRTRQRIADRHSSLRSLPQRIIVSVTGIHRSKNVASLLASFAIALTKLPKHISLVIVLPNLDARRVFETRFGRPHRVIVLHEISDEELCYLYNRAEFVVQPSLYEGFGYPVAEAMGCGAAVLAIDSSSTPEVAGGAALLIPPGDAEALASGLVRLARDDKLRQNLRNLSEQRGAVLRKTNAIGERTISAYRDVIERRAGETGNARKRVALWSSMPPLDCGVADYTAELAGEIANTHEVDVFVDPLSNPTPASGIYYRHPNDFDSSDQPDANVFQMGARSYQHYMYDPLRRYGGTVTLHDVSMGLGFYLLSKSRNTTTQFQDHILAQEGDDVVFEYGNLGASFEDFTDASLETFFDRHKLLRWIISASSKLLVHTETLRTQVKDAYPEANVGVVRMGVVDQLPRLRHHPFAAWRQALGIASGAICVGCFGIVDRVKRIEVAIRAFDALCAKQPTSVLLVVGRAYNSDYRASLREEAARSRNADRIIFLDYVPPQAFHALMGLVDVIVTLREPIRLGLSAILMRSFAAGKPIIVSDVPEWRTIGEDACVRVPIDKRELSCLSRELIRLASDEPARKALGKRARSWYLDNATIAIMASDYLRNLLSEDRAGAA